MIPGTSTILRCPWCERSTGRRVSLPRVGTTVHRGTCRKCAARFQLVIKPLPIAVKGAVVHSLTWSKLNGGAS